LKSIHLMTALLRSMTPCADREGRAVIRHDRPIEYRRDRLPATAVRLRLLTVLVLTATLSSTALAHDFKLGALRIDHPYAMPTPPGARTGAVYLRAIRNTGDAPDRLVGASTPAAKAVEIHRSAVDAQQVMRMREVDAIVVPPRGEVRVRHGGDHHLMLVELTRPLEVGARFAMTLRFERAGEREVMVWVQLPRDQREGHTHRH